MRQGKPAELTTARLILRPFTQNDQKNLFTLYGDPKIMEIRRIGTQTREECDQRLETILDQWQRRGFGYWAIIDRQSGEFIGDFGLREDPPEVKQPEVTGVALSYGLRPEYWGKNLITEAARAILKYGFSEFGFDEVYAMAETHNHASLHILKKLGFEHCFDFNMEDKVVCRNRLSRATWEKRD